MKELDIPLEIADSAELADDAIEFIRFFVAGGEDHVSLYVGGMGEREEIQWGMILADLSIHVIRALQQNGSTLNEGELREQIETAYLCRLKDRGTYSGVIRAAKH